MEHNQNIFFKNRIDAGQKLALFLKHLPVEKMILYAIPRGGVLVGSEIAHILGLPLHLMLVKQIPHPFNNGRIIGAVNEFNHLVLETNLSDVDAKELADAITKAKEYIHHLKTIYDKHQKIESIKGKVVVIIDDGISAECTIKAAVKALLPSHPEKIIVASPIASRQIFNDLAAQHIEVISIITSTHAYPINSYYQEFPQVNDMEVLKVINFLNQEPIVVLTT